MAKEKLSDSVLYFKEKCPCETEIEFEASTGMVFDKMMSRWDKTHAAHVEEAAHPPVITTEIVGHNVPAISEKMKAAAAKVEKEMLGVDPVTGVKKKIQSVVETEKISNAKWAAASEFEKERRHILQMHAVGFLSQDQATQLLEEVNKREQGKQKQAQGTTRYTVA